MAKTHPVCGFPIGHVFILVYSYSLVPFIGRASEDGRGVMPRDYVTAVGSYLVLARGERWSPYFYSKYACAKRSLSLWEEEKHVNNARLPPPRQMIPWHIACLICGRRKVQFILVLS